MKPPTNKIMVSVCTPTFNRRPFIAAMMQCFNHQTYPRDRMEWIIIDDGTDPVEDLVSQHPRVKYYRLDEKISLGKKRNMMHEKASGEIIVYMDDDDYYDVSYRLRKTKFVLPKKHIQQWAVFR